MNIRGELEAIFKDETRRRLNFKGYVEPDEDGMNDVEVQTIYDGKGNYLELDKIYGFEIINYEPEEEITY